MAKVSVLNVAVLENPSPFHSPFRFEISFECSEALADDLEWKIIYVGSAESEEFDQILDSVLVGPVPAGRHMFVFQVRKKHPLLPEIPQSASGIKSSSLCHTVHAQALRGPGFPRGTVKLHRRLRQENRLNPEGPQLQRNILASNPRVTRFHINWDNTTDRLEAIETQDPSLGCSLPLNCTPIKGLGLPGCIPGLLPENSMDCI
uniref:Anti-silencing function 1B histone chaperone n=2 Tax=Primates TaxID=9443 RepID=A0A0D9R207_CHLSB